MRCSEQLPALPAKRFYEITTPLSAQRPPLVAAAELGSLDFMRLRWSLRLLTLLAVIIVVSCLLVATFQRSVIPHYGGKSLHAWLMLLQSSNRTEAMEAAEAVREIGTNALPTLIAWLSHHDSVFEKQTTVWLAKHGLFTRDRYSENYYHSKALCGFRALGTNGQSAVPELRQLLADPADASQAAYALVWAAPSEAEKLAQDWMADTNPSVKIRGHKLKAELFHR